MLSTTTTFLPLPRPSPPCLYYLSSCRTTPPRSFTFAAGSCCSGSGAGRRHRHERAGGHGLHDGHGGAQQDGDGGGGNSEARTLGGAHITLAITSDTVPNLDLR